MNLTTYLTDKNKKNIFLSLCVIIAVCLNFFEGIIPVSGIFPGIKVGISNIVVMAVIYMFSLKEGLLLTFLKSIFITLLSGNVTSFLYSIVGGLMSAFLMGVLKNNKNLSPIGVSLSGSFIHITSQILVAYFVINSSAVFYYYPFMLLISIITGFINGIIVKMLLKFLRGE